MQRKANDLIQENNELAALARDLALNERLNRENTSLNQKISTLSLDKDAQRARLADLEAFLKTKDSQLKESELKLDDALDELDTTRNEVARLSGTETLLNDRYAMLKGENETNQDKIRSLNVELNALREEIQSLRGIANDMKFEVARKEEQADTPSTRNLRDNQKNSKERTKI